MYCNCSTAGGGGESFSLSCQHGCHNIISHYNIINHIAHCGPRGCLRCSQFWEHLYSHPGASNSRPTPGHKLIRSYLDFWLNSSTFWCKNHICILKTEGVIKYFLTTNIFPMTPCSVKNRGSPAAATGRGCRTASERRRGRAAAGAAARALSCTGACCSGTAATTEETLDKG